MKKLLFVFVLLILLGSCSGSHSKYKIFGYKGPIKKVSIYHYENEVEKQKSIGRYGDMIPSSIAEYNKDGYPIMRMDVVYDEDYGYYFVYLDSVYYDSGNKITNNVKWRALVDENDALLINNPGTLVLSDRVFKMRFVADFEYEEGRDVCIKRINTELSFDKNQLNILPKSLSNEAMELFHLNVEEPIVKGEVKETYKYEDGKIIYELHECKNSANPLYSDVGINDDFSSSYGWSFYLKDSVEEIERKYDNGQLVYQVHRYGEERQDSTIHKYLYNDDGTYQEEVGGWIHRYDELGRCFYSRAKHSETITTYRDTTEISHTINRAWNNAKLRIVNKDSLIVAKIYVKLDDEALYSDDAISILSRYRDGEISNDGLEHALDELVSKTWERCEIDTREYENYDSYGNPLFGRKSTIDISRSYYGSKNIIIRNEYCFEKEISYFD